jgi:hypothetical protein
MLSNDRVSRRTASALAGDHRSSTVPARAVCRVVCRNSSRSGSANGIGRKSAAYTAENVVVAAAIPNARVTTDRAAVPGIRLNIFMVERTAD